MPEFEIITEEFERRTYLKGGFRGKFVGYLDSQKSDRKHEDFYDLEVLSGAVSVNKSDFRTWKEGDEFDEFIIVEKFLTKLPNPLDCAVTYEDGSVKNFKINLHESKLQNFTLSHRLYEGDKVFAKIEGEISGYLKHFDTIEKKVEIIPKPEILPLNLETKDLNPSFKAKSNLESKNLNLSNTTVENKVSKNLSNSLSQSATIKKLGFANLLGINSEGCITLVGKILLSLFLIYLATFVIMLIGIASLGLVVSILTIFLGLTILLSVVANNYKYLMYYLLFFLVIILIKFLLLLMAFAWQLPLLLFALLILVYWTFPYKPHLYSVLKWLFIIIALVVMLTILF